MTKTIFSVLLALSCASSIAAPLADKHKMPSQPEQAQCIACHGGSYSAIADKTNAMNPNPHANHMGQVQCDACHSWKGQSKLMCNDCHAFPELQKGLNKP